MTSTGVQMCFGQRDAKFAKYAFTSLQDPLIHSLNGCSVSIITGTGETKRNKTSELPSRNPGRRQSTSLSGGPRDRGHSWKTISLGPGGPRK